MTKALSIAQKFYAYQRERFPMLVLGLSLLPAILSSAVVVGAVLSAIEVAMALLASLAYLLHIRIIDEHRDFSHDNAHHATRPIQSGIITKDELRYVDAGAIAVLIGIALLSGTVAFLIAALMLGYSYFAGKEFFMGERIRRRFFLYNGVNLVQMLLMQLLVYAIFSDSIPLTTLLGAHFLFTSIGTLIFEFVRKVKVPGDDGTGKDTYTWYLGFGRSLIVFRLLLVTNTVLFLWMTRIISPDAFAVPVLALCFAGSSYATSVVHQALKSRRTDQLMQLSFVITYAVFNLAIYYLMQ